MSLLAIVQGVALRCNYASPNVAISSTDAEIQRMVAFVQDTGEEMAERADWQALKFTTPVYFTGDGSTTFFSLPAGFQRLSPSDTFSSSLYPTIPLPGPVNEDDLLKLKALPMATYPSVWREAAGGIEFYPALAAGELVSYVYASGQWITNSAGQAYPTPVFRADSDLSLLPEKLLRMGAIWRWKRAKGLDYTEEFRSYEASLDRTSAQESTVRTIGTTTRVMTWDDTWPGTITDSTDPND